MYIKTTTKTINQNYRKSCNSHQSSTIKQLESQSLHLNQGKYINSYKIRKLLIFLNLLLILNIFSAQINCLEINSNFVFDYKDRDITKNQNQNQSNKQQHQNDKDISLSRYLDFYNVKKKVQNLISFAENSKQNIQEQQVFESDQQQQTQSDNNLPINKVNNAQNSISEFGNKLELQNNIKTTENPENNIITAENPDSQIVIERISEFNNEKIDENKNLQLLGIIVINSQQIPSEKQINDDILLETTQNPEVCYIIDYFLYKNEKDINQDSFNCSDILQNGTRVIDNNFSFQQEIELIKEAEIKQSDSNSHEQVQSQLQESNNDTSQIIDENEAPFDNTPQTSINSYYERDLFEIYIQDMKQKQRYPKSNKSRTFLSKDQQKSFPFLNKSVSQQNVSQSQKQEQSIYSQVTEDVRFRMISDIAINQLQTLAFTFFDYIHFYTSTFNDYISGYFSEQLKSEKELHHEKKMKDLMKGKNYASKDSGATILQTSKGVKNPKAILSASKEEYLILPSCKEDQEYSLIINLSEDVAVETIVIANHEEFSDILSEISFSGSIDYPSQTWTQLGQLKPQPGQHEHQVDVNLGENQMIRYLKMSMKGQPENELYCTITRIMVFGKGMHAVMRNSLMDLVQDQNLTNMILEMENNSQNKQQQQQSDRNAKSNKDQNSFNFTNKDVCYDHSFKNLNLIFMDEESSEYQDFQKYNDHFIFSDYLNYHNPFEFVSQNYDFKQTSNSSNQQNQFQRNPNLKYFNHPTSPSNSSESSKIIFNKSNTINQQQQQQSSNGNHNNQQNNNYQNATQLYNNDNALEKLLKTLVQKLNNNEIQTNLQNEKIIALQSEMNDYFQAFQMRLETNELNQGHLNRQQINQLRNFSDVKTEMVNIEGKYKLLLENSEKQVQYLWLSIYLITMFALFLALIISLVYIKFSNIQAQTEQIYQHRVNQQNINNIVQLPLKNIPIEDKSTEEGVQKESSPINFDDQAFNHISRTLTVLQDQNFNSLGAFIEESSKPHQKRKNKKKKQDQTLKLPFKNFNINEQDFQENDVYNNSGFQTVRNSKRASMQLLKKSIPNNHQVTSSLNVLQNFESFESKNRSHQMKELGNLTQMTENYQYPKISQANHKRQISQSEVRKFAKDSNSGNNSESENESTTNNQNIFFGFKPAQESFQKSKTIRESNNNKTNNLNKNNSNNSQIISNTNNKQSKNSLTPKLGPLQSIRIQNKQQNQKQ